MKGLFWLALFCVIACKVQAHVGVNDDYYLNAPVSFECPLVLPTTDDTLAGNVTDDGGAGDDYLGSKLPPDYPAFTFFYCWMTVFTALPLLYFAYNNRLSPVGEVKPFVPEVIHGNGKSKEVDNSNCHQTGLCTSWIGQLLYYSILLTLVGIQILLLLLVMCYYFLLDREQVKSDSPHLDLSWNPFEDGPQSLYAFIIAWAVCFSWVGFFKRPQSLHASFMRRCDLADATHVAVFIPDSRGVELLVKDGVEWNVTRIFNLFHYSFDGTLAWLFSEPSHQEPGQTAYCPVLRDVNNVRYFEFRMRRYNFNAEDGAFQPAEVLMHGTAADLLKLKDGLTTAMVRDRDAAIGANVVTMENPSLIRTLFKEFSRIFYVYQNFMAWSWFNYSYWHMGIVNTLVYISGGITVSLVNWKNAKRLQQLCHVEGTVDVLRDGRYVTIDQAQLVPGDVINIQAGIAYCDMLVLSGEAVVDESSLTGESMPVAKVAVDPTNPHDFDPLLHHKHNMIYAGTIVINQDRLSSPPLGTGPSPSNSTGKDVIDPTSTSSTSPRIPPVNTALVMKTGSYTMKGEMLREMFYGKPKKFQFDLEVSVVMLILLCYSIFSFSMTIYFLNSQPIYGFFFAIYVVASSLPPLLPTVFIVSEGISAERLLRKRVAVTDPHRILMAGKVRVAFFDKTGTLTEQGLDFHSVVTTETVKGATGGATGTATGTATGHGDVTVKFGEPAKLPTGDIARGMGVCHGLKQIIQEGTMTLLGNAIDRKMFEVTAMTLESGYGTTSDVVTDTTTGQRWAIVKQFDFDTKRKTQSVIVRPVVAGGGGAGQKPSEAAAEANVVYIYTKGTGEALKTMCLPGTIPANFDEAVSVSAKSGVYQISMGMRRLEVHDDTTATTDGSLTLTQLLTWSRDDIETQLTFVGFINFTNPMKEKTPAVIQELKEGDIRTVMISGDHVLTALYIARLSGMVHADSRIYVGKHYDRQTQTIDWVDEETGQPVVLPSWEVLQRPETGIELALIGHVWDDLWRHQQADARQLAHFVRIIGRCSPHTKITMVECFNQQGFMTMMCGDGGNDCGALKTAHVGIALSDAEASVVSSFTSLDKDIGSVVEVLKEGRCTLSSAFSSYKYMIMYGQIETINQMVCAWFAVTFSEWCWVFMDGFWVITMAFSLPYADVAAKLAPNRPTSSILGPRTLSSVLGVLLINFLFIVMALGILYLQPWYACRKWGDSQSIADVTAIGDNYESSVVFLVSGYQYITSAIAFNFGFQHRAAWYANWRFWFFVVTWTVIHFTVILYPSTLSCFFRVNCENDNVLRGATSDDLVPIQNPWHHTLMPIRFRHILLVIVIMNGVAVVLWEYFVVNGPIAAWIQTWVPKENRLLGGVGYLGPHAAASLSNKSVVNVTVNEATVLPSTTAGTDSGPATLVGALQRMASGRGGAVAHQDANGDRETRLARDLQLVRSATSQHYERLEIDETDDGDHGDRGRGGDKV